MRKLKRGVVLAVTACMCAALFAGCGDDNKTTGSLDSLGATAASSDAASSDTSSSYTDELDAMTLQEYIEYYGSTVTLGEYIGLEYTMDDTEVDDSDVEAEIEDLLSSATTYEEDYESEAELGDTVNIDFVGYIDGVEFDGGSTEGEGYDLTLGSGALIDDFEDQIVGHVPGETFDVEVTFPDDYSTTNTDLNGADAVFETTLNYIQVATEPELTDEFIAENTDCSTVDEYREEVRLQLEEEYAETAYSYAQSDVMTAAIAYSTIDNLKVSEVESLQADIIASLEEEAESYGIDYATYIYYFYGYDDEDEFAEYVYGVCEESVKEKMVVCAIALAEGITVDDDEIAEYTQVIADDYGTTTDEIESYYPSSDLRYYALADKVMSFLMDNAVQVEDTDDTEE